MCEAQAPAARPSREPAAGSREQLIHRAAARRSRRSIRPSRPPRKASPQYDEKISQPTKQDEDASIAETKVRPGQTHARAGDRARQKCATGPQHFFAQYLAHFEELRYSEAIRSHTKTPVRTYFRGCAVLLDDQVAPERRNAALVRLRKYAGLEPGYKPYTEILKQRAEGQIAKPDMVFPAKLEIETELSRNQNISTAFPRSSNSTA